MFLSKEDIEYGLFLKFVNFNFFILVICQDGVWWKEYGQHNLLFFKNTRKHAVQK